MVLIRWKNALDKTDGYQGDYHTYSENEVHSLGSHAFNHQPSRETTQDGPQAPKVGSSARNGMVKWKQAWRD